MDNEGTQLGHHAQREFAKENLQRNFEQRRTEAITAVENGTDHEGSMIARTFEQAIKDPNAQAYKGQILYEFSQLYHGASNNLAVADNQNELQKAQLGVDALYRLARLERPASDTPKTKEQLQQELAALPKRATQEHFMAKYYDAKAAALVARDGIREVVSEDRLGQATRGGVRRAAFEMERAEVKVRTEESQLLNMVRNRKLRENVEAARQRRTARKEVKYVRADRLTGKDRKDFFMEVRDRLTKPLTPQQQELYRQMPTSARNELLVHAGATFDRQAYFQLKLENALETANPMLICGAFNELKKEQAQWYVRTQEVDIALARQRAGNAAVEVKNSINNLANAAADVVRGHARPAEVAAQVGNLRNAIAETFQRRVEVLGERARLFVEPVVNRAETVGNALNVKERIEQLGHAVDKVVVGRIDTIAQRAKQKINNSSERVRVWYISNAAELGKFGVDVRQDLANLRERVAGKIEVRPPRIIFPDLGDDAATVANALRTHIGAEVKLEIPNHADYLIELYQAQRPQDMLPWIHEQELALRNAYDILLDREGKIPQDKNDVAYLSRLRDRLAAGLIAYEELEKQANTTVPEALRNYKNTMNDLLILHTAIIDRGNIENFQHDAYKNRLDLLQNQYQEVIPIATKSPDQKVPEQKPQRQSEMAKKLAEAADIGEVSEILYEVQDAIMDALGEYYENTQEPLDVREKRLKRAAGQMNQFSRELRRIDPASPQRLFPDASSQQVFLEFQRQVEDLSDFARQIVREKVERQAAYRVIGDIYQVNK